jgi:16S rRNA (guanine527-N7)-methyltransferase
MGEGPRVSKADEVRPALPLVTEAEPRTPTPAFAELCASFGIELEPAEVERLGRFLGLLLANNELLNLTAIRDEDAAWERHVFDALTLMAALSELPDGAKVADLGSGSGVPALPLAIVFPKLRFTLIEATRKKADYLSSTARALGLANVEVLAERAEAVGERAGLRESFDAVTARAVGALELLVRLGFPLLKVDGRCVFVKGERAPAELEAAAQVLSRLGGEHAGTLETPTGRLVILEKRKATPRKAPPKKKSYRF